MAKDDRMKDNILGNLDPAPGTQDHLVHSPGNPDEEDGQSTEGGSEHGVSGGTGTETGGTRNFRTGSGAIGGDIGNRPEVYKPK